MASTSVGVNAVRSPLPSVEKWMYNVPADAEEKMEEEEEEMKQEEEEEEMNRDDAEDTSTTMTSSFRSSDPPHKLKVKPHTGGDGGAEAEGSPPLPPSIARSPSRLSSSFFGRDRMVRAARAWREGARRAGLFLDEEEDEEKEEEEEEGEERAGHPEEEDPLTKNQVEEREEEGDEDPASETHTRAATALRRVDPRIPRLAPARLAPKTRVSKLALAWMALDRIEYIAIRDAFVPDDDDGTVYYILDVYHYQEQHSIPTHHRHAMRSTPPPPHRQPDLRVQQRFSSFTRLRKNVLMAASCKHAEPCAYCDKMADFALTSSPLSLGWRAKLFTNVEMRKVLLTKFITQLVVLARERRDACPLLESLAASSNQQLHRHVTRTVPGLVKKFLTVQTGEHFMLR